MKKKKKVTKKVKAKDTYDIYLHYTEHRSGGEPTSPGEEFSGHEPEYIDFTPLSFYHFLVSGNAFVDKLFLAHSEHTNADYRHFNTELNPAAHESLYAVIVRYTTGDTFGVTHGAWEIEKIVTNKQDAEKIKKDIENETGDYSPKLKKYHSWKGYFESLESVGIKKLDIICHA